MNKKVLFVVFGFLLISVLFFINSDIVDDKYILLEFSYSGDSIILLSKSLETGNYPEILHENELDYRLNLISNEGINLYSDFFEPISLFSDAPGDSTEEITGGSIELTEIVFFVTIPNYEESEKIEILKDGKIIFEGEVYDVNAISCRIK